MVLYAAQRDSKDGGQGRTRKNRMDKTGQNGLYSVKMRASRGGANISGAERIVPSDTVAKTAAALAERALSHPKGAPDFVNIKIEGAGSMLRLKALPVSTNVTHTAEKGIAKAAELLAGAGITRIDEIMSLFSETYAMRGAMLLDADTLERLEPDRARGVRATYMDDAESLARLSTSGKNHYAEAIVLATKVQHAPGIVGEICVSDELLLLLRKTDGFSDSSKACRVPRVHAMYHRASPLVCIGIVAGGVQTVDFAGAGRYKQTPFAFLFARHEGRRAAGSRI